MRSNESGKRLPWKRILAGLLLDVLAVLVGTGCGGSVGGEGRAAAVVNVLDESSTALQSLAAHLAAGDRASALSKHAFRGLNSWHGCSR